VSRRSPREASADRRVAATPSPRPIPLSPKRRGVGRFTKVLIAVGVLATASALGGQWVLHQPFFQVRHVSLLGVHHETEAQVLSASGLASHPAMIDVSASSIERNLVSFPWISSVSLSKHWPDSVVVTVHESSSVAVGYNSHHVLEYISASGQDLGTAPLAANLPTLAYAGASLGPWPFAGPARGAAEVASQLPKAFAGQVAEVTENAQGDVTLKMESPVSFVLGPPSNLHAKFVAIASVILHTTLGVGDVVNVTVPDELAVSGPAPLQ
jgi:cell division protein FtsQ